MKIDFSRKMHQIIGKYPWNEHILLKNYNSKTFQILIHVHVHDKKWNRFATKRASHSFTFEQNVNSIEIPNLIISNMCLHWFHMHLHLLSGHKIDII